MHKNTITTVIGQKLEIPLLEDLTQQNQHIS